MFLYLFIVLSVQDNTSIELMQHLFNEGYYDKRVIPSAGLGVNAPLNVSMGLALMQIENLVSITFRNKEAGGHIGVPSKRI